jgi:uncharacterized protein YbjT (DUF2867 family)
VPVVVTGAGGGIGRVLVPLLAERGEVRAVVRGRGGGDALRAEGAKVAALDLTDTVSLAAVMDGAHTVIHLAGGLDFPDDAACEAANLGTVRDALEAAEDAGVARFVLVSYPGASPKAANVYLRAKGMAEDAVRGSPVEHVILRSTHVYGPGQRWLDEMLAAATRPIAAVVVGPGTQRMAPAFVEDVARALLAADDRASRVEGTFGLEGPDVVIADALIDLLAGRRRRKVHLRPEGARRASRLLGRSVSLATMEILSADSLADAPDAAAEFHIRLTGLRPGLAASTGRPTV